MEIQGVPLASAPPALTRKEVLWLSCKEKVCCIVPTVVPTGYDVWRIARALDVPPWSFLIYFRTLVPARDAFALDATGPQFRLALAKQGGFIARRPKRPPCIFLLRLRDGSRRCGLGDLRPLVCRSFPAEVQRGVVTLRQDGGCTCRHWTLADVEIEEERALVERRQVEAERYCAVVAEWNARVAAAPPGAGFDFLDYCRYLMETYDALAVPASTVAHAPEIRSRSDGNRGAVDAADEAGQCP